MNCSMPGFPVHHQLLELVQTHAHQVRDAVQPSPPLLSSSPPAFSLSHHQGLFQCQFFTSGGESNRASISASLLPVNIQDWFSLGWTGWMLAVQGTLKSPLHYSSKVLILQCSAFFIVQLSHPHMTTGKTTALTRWAFVTKVMSLLFNMLLSWSYLFVQGVSIF